MNIIGHKYIFLTVAGILVLGSLLAFGFWGLKLGIDFTGGSLLEVEFTGVRPAIGEARPGGRPGLDLIKKTVRGAGLENVSIQPIGVSGLLLRFGHVDEQEHQKIIKAISSLALATDALQERRFDTIGPTIGAELRRNAFLAIALAIAGIVLYIAWAFRTVSKPISSWKYGCATVAALIHDVIIPVGIFAVLGHFWGIEVDTLFITALLTILGFSVHDTIVVFDRIRENLRNTKGVESFAATVNRSMNETMARSINTSFTVLLVLLVIAVFGGEGTLYFALALIFGITFGTYSSIFVASPLLVVWEEVSKKRAGRQKESPLYSGGTPILRKNG